MRINSFHHDQKQKVEEHIASVVVYIKPQGADQVLFKAKELAASLEGSKESIDIYEESLSQNKLILVLDCQSARDLVKLMDSINDWPEVLNAAPIYHHFEHPDDLDAKQNEDFSPTLAKTNEAVNQKADSLISTVNFMEPSGNA